MKRGLYVVFEGLDGSGKSTIMQKVSVQLSAIIQKEIILTKHPGSTSLGAHIRQLVKYPKSIDDKIIIDDLSRQLLYMADTSSFINLILKPQLEKNSIVFADRSSFISALMYGLADNLNINDITNLTSIVTSPLADRVYILNCPAELAANRLFDRAKDEHYDQKPIEYFKKLELTYSNLLADPMIATAVSRIVHLDDIIYMNAASDINFIANKITDDILGIILERCS